jgi:hydrogenase-4 component B
MLHVWNHGVFKSLLFFGAGSVLHATGTREMSRLGGLWRAMPWTTALFALGSLAVCALPPLNGFVSEWLIYRGLFEGAASRTTGAAIALPAAIVLATTGALALATFIKGGAMTFLGAPRSAAARHAHEAGGWMRGPMLIAAAAAVMLALAPASIAPVLTHVSSAWRSGASADLGPTGLISVGTVQITIALLLITSITVLWRRAHAQPAGSGPTWDCGYALPTARMQYTSGSFSGIAAGWFRWILLPASELRRPRGVFPRAAYWAERTPETVLERVLQPVARVVLGAAAVVRWLQHGRLQFYVAYVAAGVVTLAMLAILGGKP